MEDNAISSKVGRFSCSLAEVIGWIVFAIGVGVFLVIVLGGDSIIEVYLYKNTVSALGSVMAAITILFSTSLPGLLLVVLSHNARSNIITAELAREMVKIARGESVNEKKHEEGLGGEALFALIGRTPNTHSNDMARHLSSLSRE